MSHRRHSAWLAVCLLTAALTAEGCRCNAALHRYGPNATLKLGSGGGFTGSYSGYVVHADGVIERWRKDVGHADSTWRIFTTSPDSVGRFFAALSSTGFDTLEFVNPGNLTYFIELRTADTVRSVRWGDPSIAPPDTLVGLYRAIHLFIESH